MSPVFHLQGAHILVENRGNKKGDVFLKEEGGQKGFLGRVNYLSRDSRQIAEWQWKDLFGHWNQMGPGSNPNSVSLTHINDVEIV